MTSYSEKNGRMIADQLPADFGQKMALKDPKLAKWAARQRAKYAWCGTCNIAILTTTYEEHVRITHWKKKDADRARALRR